MSTTEFGELLARVRQGDQHAAEELVRRYEQPIRIAVRTRLTDPALRRQLDSVDVCQSVLASFFLRAAAGQFDLTEPAQLVGLLVRMATNKLASQARRHMQQKRDAHRVSSGGDELMFQAGNDPSPSRVVAGREMLELLRAQLSPDERELADRRGQGMTWQEIADDLGGTAQARRKQFTRAIDRIAPGLGLDDNGEVTDEDE